MLTVTDKAAQYVRETLKKESAPGATVRIVKTEKGYHLTFDEAKEGDQVFEHEGENYLLWTLRRARPSPAPPWTSRSPPKARDSPYLRIALPSSSPYSRYQGLPGRFV